LLSIRITRFYVDTNGMAYLELFMLLHGGNERDEHMNRRHRDC
jgi:hypothetical protein